MTEGYKLTELGEIPEDWRVIPLGKISIVSSGGTPLRTNKSYWNGDIPWITTSEINFNSITNSNEYITAYGLANSAAKIYPKGTLLIAMYGQGKTRGKTAILEIDATTNQACAAICLKKKIDNKFIYYFLASQYDQIRKLSNTGNQENLNGEIIKTILVPFPAKEEQTAIAKSLSDTDALIISLEKLIEKKRKIKKGTIQMLLSGKKRLQGFTDPWKIKKIGQIFKFLGTANNSRSDLSDDGIISYIHYGDIHTKWSNFLDCSTAKIPFIGKTKINKNVTFIEEGDLIMADASEDHEGLGACIEVKNLKNKKVVAGLHTILLRGDKRIVADGFKGYLRELDGFYYSLVRLASGISVYSITKRNLAEIEIKLPSIEEQIAISNVITDMDNQIVALEIKLQKFRQIKHGMMQQLLTGKKRLIKVSK